MLSHHPPLEHGQDSIKLKVINCHPEDFNTGLKTRVKKAITKKQGKTQSSIQESPVINNQEILEDRKNTLSQDTQVQSLNQTLVQDLTSREPVLEPFFNPSLKEISKKLWLPIETDLAVCHLTSSNGSLLNSGQSLQVWTTLNMKKVKEMSSPMISWKLSQSSQLDTMAAENTRSLKQKESKINPNTLSVWDIEANGWRSFRWDSIQSVKVL